MKFLKSLTGLDFVPSETSDMKIWESGILPKCSCEIQRWTHSSYTLIHDKNSEFSNESLDVVLRIPFREADEDGRNENDEVPKSGHLIYIDSESKEEECVSNSLVTTFLSQKSYYLLQ